MTRHIFIIIFLVFYKGAASQKYYNGSLIITPKKVYFAKNKIIKSSSDLLHVLKKSELISTSLGGHQIEEIKYLCDSIPINYIYSTEDSIYFPGTIYYLRGQLFPLRKKQFFEKFSTKEDIYYLKEKKVYLRYNYFWYIEKFVPMTLKH